MDSSTVDACVVRCAADAFANSPLAQTHSPDHTVIAVFVAIDRRGIDGSHPTTPLMFVPISIGVGTRSVGYTTKQRKVRRLLAIDDGHAEVMARRGFVSYLLADIRRHVEGVDDGLWTPLRWKDREGSGDDGPRVPVWDPSVECRLVVTQVPCGAFAVTPSFPSLSTGAHVLLAVPGEDKEPARGGEMEMESNDEGGKRTQLKPSLLDAKRDPVVHEGHVISRVMDEGVHWLPVVSRTKPGAGVPSLSMSCSDKLIRWMSCGLQGRAMLHVLPHGAPLSRILHIAKLPCDAFTGARPSSPSTSPSSDCLLQLQHQWTGEVSAAFTETVRRRIDCASPRSLPTTSTTQHRDVGIRWFDLDPLMWKAKAPSGGSAQQTSAIFVCPPPQTAPPPPRSTAVITEGRKRLRSGDTPSPKGTVLYVNTKDGVTLGITQQNFAKAVEALEHGQMRAAGHFVSLLQVSDSNPQVEPDEAAIMRCGGGRCVNVASRWFWGAQLAVIMRWMASASCAAADVVGTFCSHVETNRNMRSPGREPPWQHCCHQVTQEDASVNDSEHGCCWYSYLKMTAPSNCRHSSIVARWVRKDGEPSSHSTL